MQEAVTRPALALLLLAMTGCASVPSRPLGAAWCAEQSDDGPGCDVGVALALARHDRLSWVGALGAETLGTGVAWSVAPDAGRPLAVSLGLVVRWDGTGIDTTQAYPAIGATINLTKREDD